MQIQLQILKRRNQIMLMNAILIVCALLNTLLIHFKVGTDLLLLLASVIGAIPILIQAYQALKVRVISIDLLVIIAVVGALIIHKYEESAVVSFLFLLGAYLEKKTLNKTHSAINNLVKMAPSTALKVRDDGTSHEIEIDDIEIGDTLLVKTGSKLPVDGKVIQGAGSVNEASITGEPKLVSKKQGSSVFAGTILEDGALSIRAEKVSDETTFGKIIELVEEAQDSKSKTEKFIDRFSTYYTPAVLLFAIIVGIVSKNFELAITVLVLGCPGALVIGIPIASVSGIGNGAKNGILFKGGETINKLSHVDTVFFDKTGTLTYGKPQVNTVINYDKNDLAEKILVNLERNSDHPLAQAVINYYQDLPLVSVDDLQVIKGQGMIAKVAQYQVVLGNQQLMEQKGIQLTADVLEQIQQLENKGNSIVLEAINGRIALLIGIKDTIRKGIKKDLIQLKKLGVKNLILLSGDNQVSTERVAKELGLTAAVGNLLPKEKADIVKSHQFNNEIVAFVGDGINDSPSIALADIGIAMGNGTDVAIETSDVVLMNSNFNHLPHALGLAKATNRNMIENILIALMVVIVLLFSLFFSSWMNMAIGMFVHEASILVVTLNGMRLLKYKKF